jgi:hypothetical protein
MDAVRKYAKSKKEEAKHALWTFAIGALIWIAVLIWMVYL